MKCKLLRPMPGATGEVDATGHAIYQEQPIGFEINDPNCFRLVQMGIAEPSDDECRDRAGMTPEKMELASEAYDRLIKGQSTGDPRYDTLASPEDDEIPDPFEVDK